jgi:DMSO reductase anchor subunit
MHPAPSLILFTTLSGLGFGLLFWLGIDATPPTGWVAFTFFAIAYALVLGGLFASTRHLGRPERALKAFTQWRTSWLSREAWLAGIALTIMALYAAPLVFFGGTFKPLGWLGAIACLSTVAATAMIYAQLKTVPRWHHWSTPALFLLYALTGGALLSGRVTFALALLAATGLAQAWAWWDGDRRLTTPASDTGTATGLGQRGAVRPFEPPHTGGNYLTREMGFTVARKHAEKLRIISLALACGLPFLFLLLPFHHMLAALALVSHGAGVALTRWLFFAQAEHLQRLYYPAH